jgi:hypothetical protein
VQSLAQDAPAAVLRHHPTGIMSDVVDARSPGMGASRLELLGHRAVRVRRAPRRRRSSSTFATGRPQARGAPLSPYADGAANPFARIDQAEAPQWLGIEHFRRAPDSPAASVLECIGEPVESA